MRFLVRMAFWLTIILVLLPSGGSQSTSKTSVSAIDAVSAAAATVSDMRSFCERQPEACSVGSQAATVIGQRAQAGAKMLYDYLNEPRSADDGASHTASTAAKPVPLPAARPSQHTLTPADLATPWRGPTSRGKDGRGDRPA
ncbi:MAG: DUF5330 domain-containing protein [Hyphomicrobiales bacterium]|nr:DUF5330 domain-containing protein [Hyphomicrobiales bacterium]